jgi:tRNA1(Val) A37 N6-methylase TrmN6
VTRYGTSEAEPSSIDAFLGGRVEAVQPGRGHHRSGLEAVLLGAALPGGFRGTIVDLGAGAGVAGFCAAWRCPAADVVLVERNSHALSGAREGLARPANAGIAPRVRIIDADLTAPPADRQRAGLFPGMAQAVIVNPPFHRSGSGTASPAGSRAGAHVLADTGLDPWMRVAAGLLGPQGVIVAIFRADGLLELLDVLGSRFGGLAILPIHPRAGLSAHRVIVAGRKGSRAAPSLLPGLVLHGDTGSAFLPHIQRVLAEGAGLAEALPAWQAAIPDPS